MDLPKVVRGPGSTLNPLRRVGLLGDVHAEDQRLEAALKLFSTVDEVLCVGDVVDGEGELSKTIDLLEAHKVRVVRGNHERWFLADEMRTLKGAHLADQQFEAWNYVRFVPPQLELQTVRGPTLLCHAILNDDMLMFGPDTSTNICSQPAMRELLGLKHLSFVVTGHTHKFMVRTLEHLTFINPGTLFRHHQPECSIWDVEAQTIERFGLDDPQKPEILGVLRF